MEPAVLCHLQDLHEIPALESQVPPEGSESACSPTLLFDGASLAAHPDLNRVNFASEKIGVLR